MFQNYSQTYAAAITAFVGLMFSAAAAFGFSLPLTSEEATFIIGQVINLAGIAWVIHRQIRGDLNAVEDDCSSSAISADRLPTVRGRSRSASKAR